MFIMDANGLFDPGKVIPSAEFITAFLWAYGGTKAHAAKVYREAEDAYIKELIQLYRQQCRLAFYND